MDNVISALYKASPYAAKKHILATICFTKASVSKTAKSLRVSIPTLYMWIKKLELKEQIEELVKVRRFNPKSKLGKRYVE